MHGICPFSQAETRTSIGCERSEKVFKSIKSIKSIGAGYPHAAGKLLSTRSAVVLRKSADHQCIDRMACRARIPTARCREYRRGSGYPDATVVACMGPAAHTPLLAGIASGRSPPWRSHQKAHKLRTRCGRRNHCQMPGNVSTARYACGLLHASKVLESSERDVKQRESNAGISEITASARLAPGRRRCLRTDRKQRTCAGFECVECAPSTMANSPT